MSTTGDLEAAAKAKIFWRLIPYILILYAISFLDRVNVGYAALSMNKALGFSSAVFGFGAGIFFIGYFVMEVPGNIILYKWSARLWISRILISWGIVAVLMGFIHTKGEFYSVRFLLGVAEASFYPGIIYYLSCWFRSKERARAIALFMLAIPISNIFGAPISTSLLGVHWLNLEGWRWLFILEGIPAVVFGVITPFYLTDKPSQAKWLSEDEKNWITNELIREQKSAKQYTLWQSFKDRDVMILTVLYFLWMTGYYGIIMWLPTIVKSLSANLSTHMIGWIVPIPYIGALLGMIVIAISSDKKGERRCHTSLALLIAGIGLAISAMLGKQVALSIAFYTVAMFGAFGAYAPFWSLPTSFLTQIAAAGSIAFINSIGNLGGFVGPYIVGILNGMTKNFFTAFIFLVVCLVLAGLLPFLLRKSDKDVDSPKSPTVYQ